MARKVFEQEQFNRPRKSAFDLSREHKLSCNMGELIPAYVEEILPGDEFQVNSEIMMRLAPMVSPVMHRVNVFMHYFFVPNRLVWDEWEDFITGGQDGTSTPTFPTGSTTSTPNGHLRDYLGFPTFSGGDSIEYSEIPLRAYQAIWNEYYRDETLQDELDINNLSAGDLATLRHRCWEKDYFTSALPWPQRGDAVGIPVQYMDVSEVKLEDGTDATGDAPLLANLGSLFADEDNDGIADSGETARIENIQGIDVNELRISTALQRWLETQARGGYRYIETILSHFGERVSDFRLQRPEYLGGGKQNVVISEVLNTSSTSTEPQGEMAGHGIAVGNQNRFRRKFEEHGYVIGILSVLPRTAYQQGIHRHWSRREKEDYYWPLFANLGEQEIKNKEIYLDENDEAYREGTFGYQQRYSEYKYGCSRVSGAFRDTLDFWHIGRIFDSQPNLNETFVRYPDRNDAPDKRIFAVEDNTDKLWVQIFHNVQARRPMPYFADPRLT